MHHLRLKKLTFLRRIAFFALCSLLSFPLLLSGAPVRRYPHIRYGIPGKADVVLLRQGFAIGYSHSLRQAIWVSYQLRREHLTVKPVRRTNKFVPDPDISRAPVQPVEYHASGFDRGHLAPAADMAYAMLPMEQSFFMSNISPQLPGCNRGIWKRLESLTRTFARQEKRILVITGPIFTTPKPKFMKNSEIPVPDAFYKIIFDLTPPQKMIAFIIPNQASRKHLRSFVVTVDDVEKITGLNFFSNMPNYKEHALESRSDFNSWHPSRARKPAARRR